MIVNIFRGTLLPHNFRPFAGVPMGCPQAPPARYHQAPPVRYLQRFHQAPSIGKSIISKHTKAANH